MPSLSPLLPLVLKGVACWCALLLTGVDSLASIAVAWELSLMFLSCNVTERGTGLEHIPWADVRFTLLVPSVLARLGKM